MRNLINRKPLLLSADMEIDQALREMITRRVSSALIFDGANDVVGIVTERDILRKLSLLEVDRKLGHKINTIMSRPVHFVQEPTLQADIIQLHTDHGLRHFPILKGKGPHKCSDVVGIITVTDIARYFLSTLVPDSRK